MPCSVNASSVIRIVHSPDLCAGPSWHAGNGCHLRFGKAETSPSPSVAAWVSCWPLMLDEIL